jgi:hypothetical protein
MLSESNLPWWRHDRPWGFRFSAIDAVTFATGAVATVIAWLVVGPYSLLLPFVLLHFFLFCNTFRLGGERDLVWIGTLVVNACFWNPLTSPAVHIMIQLAITAALIAHCVFGRNYHGIACERINPEGYRAGALTEGAFTRRVLLKLGVPRNVIEMLTGRKLQEFEQ